jgi:hypothetical protein
MITRFVLAPLLCALCVLGAIVCTWLAAVTALGGTMAHVLAGGLFLCVAYACLCGLWAMVAHLEPFEGGEL